MSEDNLFEAEDVQGVENVLADTTMPAVTRRNLLSKAAVGTAAVGAFGAVGPIPAALASSSTISTLINTAATLEALAVTFVSGVVENASPIGIASNLVPVLKAANAAEYDHYKALTSVGAKPLTTKFWAPNSVLASSNAVFATVEYVEAQSQWRNRDEFFEGREAIRAFLTRKWARELHYVLRKELWCFTENRISVRFEYESQDPAGQWWRSHGNEHWEFDEHGPMGRRATNINDYPIEESARRSDSGNPV